jgi:hypothetical protein
VSSEGAQHPSRAATPAAVMRLCIKSRRLIEFLRTALRVMIEPPSDL